MEQSYFLSRNESVRTNFNVQNGSVSLTKRHGLRIYYIESNSWKEFDLNAPIPAPLVYEGLIRIEAIDAGINSATLINTNSEGNEIDRFSIHVDVCKLSIRNDSDRDGDIDLVDNSNESWVWGDEQRGAIVLVNNDKDINEIDPENITHSEWSEFVVGDTLLSAFPDDVRLILSASEGATNRFTVYAKSEGDGYERILGVDPTGQSDPISFSNKLPINGSTYYLEAHEYAGADFAGLITIELLLVKGQSVISSDSAVFRVAPWIMTPNTLTPIRAFTCRMVNGANTNDSFIEGLQDALNNANVPLTIIEPQDHMGDRWIQDEIEFGYVQGASHTLPVVLDSPRDRGLDDFPEKNLLGPDFGHFQIGGTTPNSLDSFGNLEVSPPSEVNGRQYPFGRIVFGGKKFGDYSESNRQMMPHLRKFFYAQKVQSPFEIYTDWLTVGHVDEIICFIPAHNDIGYQVLVASPQRAKAILERLQFQGHGDSVMFKEMMRGEPRSGDSAEISVTNLLNDIEFWLQNGSYQTIMDSNSSILKKELGLTDEHIIQIPVLFHPTEPQRTAAYFPDMVNHLVVGNTSIVPKPHGPIIDGECAFEKSFKDALPEREVVFVDDWYSYHEMLGEVHCGTNLQRQPFPNKTWWSHKPEGCYDI